MLQDEIAQDMFSKDYKDCEVVEQQQINTIIRTQFV